MKTRLAALAAALAYLPLAAAAMPEIGAVVGTNPEEAKAALMAAGCEVQEFEAEDGQIEAKCTDTATGKLMEVYIDPAKGTVSKIKEED